VRPPNTSRALRDWLRTRLAVPVEQTSVDDPPASWVRVQPTGGAGLASRVLWRAVVTAECYATTPAAAWSLAADVCEHAAAWQGQTGVYDVDVGVPRDFPDVTGTPRFLVDIGATLRTVDS